MDQTARHALPAVRPAMMGSLEVDGVLVHLSATLLPRAIALTEYALQTDHAPVMLVGLLLLTGPRVQSALMASSSTPMEIAKVRLQHAISVILTHAPSSLSAWMLSMC